MVYPEPGDVLEQEGSESGDVSARWLASNNSDPSIASDRRMRMSHLLQVVVLLSRHWLALNHAPIASMTIVPSVYPLAST
eukprot:3367173-Amphidinium_carterae.1